MCGIVGYVGHRSAYPVVIKGLKRLEYRGYDSAGIAFGTQSSSTSDNSIRVYKTKGKVADLEKLCDEKNIDGTCAIGHTRWATHGEPNDKNAHPHYSTSHRFALIHNGIIENFRDLRNSLETKGVKFCSDTDTEVLVQLIEYIADKRQLDALSALQYALHKVFGAYAIALFDAQVPDQIIVARKQSPLVVGVGEDNKEFFLGSDASPIVEYTDKVVYLEDNQIAVLRKDEDLHIVTLNNKEVEAKVSTLDLKIEQIEKVGYDHFMLKEIFEQPESIINCMRGRINVEGTDVRLSAIIDHREALVNAQRFVIVACGTSWHAGLIGKQLLEQFCRVPVEVEHASEFRYRNPVILPTDVVIAISQSGETADTMAALELAKEKGAFVFGIVNAVGSSIARVSNTGCYIHVGPEIGVASTKAFTGQVTVLTLLSLALAKEKGTISKEDYEKVTRELQLIPDKMRHTIRTADEKIRELSKMFTYARNFLYLGRGYNYPIAMEGALKLKEISYIHAEGYPAAEMKHGPIALIDAEMPCVVVATQNKMYDKVISNIQEIKARKGRILAIITEGENKVEQYADAFIAIPKTLTCLEPLLTCLPLQLMAYYVAINKGLNVDQPRNLAKSVTVE